MASLKAPRPSKCFAATGLRVGWVYAPPAITRRIKDMIGHVGAWAPRPEQVALARFLADEAAVRAYQDDMNRRVQERLEALYDGFQLLKNDGYAVECIEPQGAIYLSLQLKLIGKSIDGQRIENNEQVRKLLLDRAGMAVVPFQAFGFEGDSGWFRMSVGAVSMQDIADSFPRVRKLLDEIS